MKPLEQLIASVRWIGGASWAQRATLALAAVGAAGSLYAVTYLLGIDIRVPGLPRPVATPREGPPPAPPAGRIVTPVVPTPGSASTRVPPGTAPLPAPPAAAPVAPGSGSTVLPSPELEPLPPPATTTTTAPPPPTEPQTTTPPETTAPPPPAPAPPPATAPAPTPTAPLLPLPLPTLPVPVPPPPSLPTITVTTLP